MIFRYNVFLLALLLVSCNNSSKEVAIPVQSISSLPSSYSEKYRPQFHFSPPEKWMNDPNGLVYHQGKYHLFYQYYPDDIVWGPMHWGHAVSEDLVRWQHKPIALYPDELGFIFSGSAVLDRENTSGFGSLENPPLVAIYTYHHMEGEKEGRTDFQTQGIAYSLDNGDSWKKYSGNPVIGNSGIKDFRDPKVFWHDASNRWILTLVAGDRAMFYGSSDLKSWNVLSEFGKEKGAHGGVWECPDLFELSVGDSEEKKWVLLISINPGAPNGGSGTQYFVGDFDGTTFSTLQTEHKWIDFGRDNYAGVTYNNTPNNERIFIGWMSNWDYARDTPTEAWRSAMTLPRTLSLHQNENGYFLRNYPVGGLEKLTSELARQDEVSLVQPYQWNHKDLNQSEIRFDVNLSEAIKVELGNDSGEKVIFEMNPETGELTFDRRQSGQIQFSESFAPALQKQTYQPKSEVGEVRILLDASSVEIFLDQGALVFTNQIFPRNAYTTLEISSASSTRIKSFNVHKLTSIWNNYE